MLLSSYVESSSEVLPALGAPIWTDAYGNRGRLKFLGNSKRKFHSEIRAIATLCIPLTWWLVGGFLKNWLVLETSVQDNLLMGRLSPLSLRLLSQRSHLFYFLLAANHQQLGTVHGYYHWIRAH